MLNLIPMPKKISYGTNPVQLKSFNQCKLSGVSEYMISQIKNHFCDLKVCDENQGFYFEISNGNALNKLNVVDKNDAYSLSASQKGVRIDANNSEGLFYGLQTLLSLPDELTECEIEDYASVPMRMLHVDLKGYIPHFEVLKEELKIFASYKVNAILLELEDKYQFKCAPAIAVPGAYTFEQMRELSVLAKDLNIKIVPLLQCMGHVDYVNKRKEYARLREDEDAYNYDPYNPEVKSFWENLAEEIMECFKEHNEYFHVGADESYLPIEAYCKRVKESLDFVKAKGRTPIMWDDMVRVEETEEGNEMARKEKSMLVDGVEVPIREILCKDVVLMYWVYGYGGHNDAFEFIKRYKEEGLRIWGASGFSGCDNWAGSVPPLEYRAKNADNWTERAVANDIECVCATGWTRIASADCPAEPYESCWATILYAAQSMWSGRKIPLETFIKQLFVNFYGQEPDLYMIDFLMNISRADYDFEMARKVEGNDRLRFLCYAAALEKLEFERDLLVKYFQYYEGKLMNGLEGYRHGLVKGRAEKVIATIDQARVEVEELFSKFYKDVTVEEVMRTRFNVPYKIAKELLRQIEVTERI